jgi:hypothetical protein
MKKQLLTVLFAATAATALAQITDTGNNVGIGNATPASKLDVNGSINLSVGNRITIGGVNLLNATGTRNIAIGDGSGAANTTGTDNTFIGYQAGKQNSSGVNNTFIGRQAGAANYEGSNLVIIGNRAGFANTTGSDNNLLGFQAGLTNTVGSGNNFFGKWAGRLNVSGGNNSFFGTQAGQSNTIGSSNTYVGYKADGSADLTNATALGANAMATQSNSVILGNNANVGIGTMAPSYKLDIVGTTGPRLRIFSQDGYFAGLVAKNNTHEYFIGIQGNYESAGGAFSGFHIYDNTAGARRMVIDATGNMGIGTSSPMMRLDVSGSARITGSLFDSNSDPGAPGQILSSTGTGTDWVSATAGPAGPTGPTGLTGLVGPTGATGIQGIQGTQGPSGANGIDGATGPIGPTGPTGSLVSGTLGQTLRNDGTTWVATSTIYNDGTNVGIGSSTPATLLHINGANPHLRVTGGVNAHSSLELFEISGGTNYGYEFEYDGNQDDFYLWSRGFSGNEAIRLTVEKNGNLGIGTTTPGAKLEVSGQVKITGGIPGAGKLLTSDANGLASWSNIGQHAWSITGNSGTVDGVNFIGTIDSIPLIFKVNNQRAAKIDPAYASSTSFGYQALNSNTGGKNAAFGYNALYSNSDGTFNTATGNEALRSNTTGDYNTASGHQALFSNVAGRRATAIGYRAMTFVNNTSTPFENYNVALGYEALRGSVSASANTGNNNTAIGYQSLLTNSTGNWNSAIGTKALGSNTTASGNTAHGYEALTANTSGTGNTAVGLGALETNTTGPYNAAVGYHALVNNTTGGYNTAIGNSALAQTTTAVYASGVGYSANSVGGAYDNSTGLGHNADATASNMVMVGDASVTSIKGQVSFTAVSDQRFKKNIKDNEVKGLEFITKLRPVTYNFDTKAQASWKEANYGEVDSANYVGKYDIEKIRFSGFLAQEVEAVAKEIGYAFSGVDAPKNSKDVYGLRYAEFVVPLVKAVQEQQQQLEQLKPENMVSKEEFEAKLGEKDAEIAELKSMMREILANQQKFDTDLQSCCFDHSAATGTSNGNEQSTTDTPKLEQNIPNPFRENTTIKYYLPSDSRIATISISDLNGVQLKQFDLQGKGFGQVLISGGSFAAGTYVYTLTVNGKQVDSKKMMLL